MTIANEIARLFAASPGQSISVAESLTSGWLQAELTSISGSSQYYRGGVTTYALPMKTKLLGVNATEASACNGVSASIARQMADGACRLFETTLGISTTGYAEPAQEGEAPYAYWCVARFHADGTWEHEEGRVDCPGLSRVEVQEKVTQTALAGLREMLRRSERRATLPQGA